MKAIILVGGLGKRLWPLSRSWLPKQFVRFPFLKKTLFQMAYERARHVADDIIIVTNEYQSVFVKRNLEEMGVKEKNILIEPEARNTLSAVVYGMHFVNDSALVIPSDHLIKDISEFVKAVEEAKRLSKHYLVTFGITPSSPKTCYGYINHEHGIVKEFKEKPDEETARRYVKEGYLWNSGMFLFDRKVFDEELAKAGFVINSVEDIYSTLPETSIDYGLMEKSTRIAVVPLNAGWNDLGSFEAIFEEFKYVPENAILKGSDNVLVMSDKKVCLIDVSNLVIVDSTDALLVSKLGSSYKVKEFADDKPWASVKLLDESDLKVRRITIFPKKSFPLQNQYLIVVRGRATIRRGDKKFVLGKGERIPEADELINGTDEILELIEISL